MIFRLLNPHFSPGGWASAGKVFIFSTLQRCVGSLQGTDCAGRIRAYLRSSTRDDCCRRLRGSGVELSGSMGLRPRLSADAAFAAYSNPRLAPGDYSMNPVPLGKAFVFTILQRCVGSLQGTDCAGRIRAYLRSSTRDDCCRRLRGSGVELSGSMGLRPRLSADAAFAAYSNPRLAPGDYSMNPVPLQCRDFGESGEAAVGLAHPRKRPLQVFLIKRRSRAST